MANKLVQIKDKDNNKLYPSTILEIITNSDGEAIKYADGTMIATLNKDYTGLAQTFGWGSLYRTDPISLPNYPANFVEVYSRSLTIDGKGFGWGSATSSGLGTLNNPGNFFLIQPNSTTSANCRATVIAIGRWK